MAVSRVITLGAAATLALIVSSGTADAAVASPRPSPAPASAAGAPVVPGEAETETPVLRSGVVITPYVIRAQRAFGFVAEGLAPTDQTRVTWRSVINPKGVTGSAVYRGADPAAGRAGWFSGHQGSWTDATFTVVRDGVEVASRTIVNDDRPVIVTRSRRGGFVARVSAVRPGDMMRVDWVGPGGLADSYVGPAGVFRATRMTGWSRATVRVYEGENPANLLAEPVVVTPPAAGSGAAADQAQPLVVSGGAVADSGMPGQSAGARGILQR